MARMENGGCQEYRRLSCKLWKDGLFLELELL